MVDTPKNTPVELADDNKAEAKTRFNAALEEAKAGAAALGAEAKQRMEGYRDQAKTKGEDMKGDARGKASNLATEGKAKVSGAIASLGKLIDENAVKVDEAVGAQYGDCVRIASKKLDETASALDEKSVEELTEETRQFIRRRPSMSVGIAAAVGYLFARTFRSSK
ncbi:hypothetical protein [Altericroceibacterium endophyticum]|uniref:DUF883 family protein n=1 Tax=Altericroceibacterium endophyticum TaxID=1808508 RepID=A0A6I4T4M5_9SPHN|nr:hypothetical protein [Altericroceibacterium endophyticum]MXO64595.1 hypothetical protein [Altericroceibacterium endophyticum]